MTLDQLLKPLKKFITVSCMAGALATTTLAQNNPKTSLDLEVGFLLDYESHIIVVSNIPEKIRSVPIHPDDGYARPENNGPIADALLDYSPISIKLEGRFGIKHENSGWGIGSGISLEYPLISTSETKRRNYTNAPGTANRGEGAALTYYGFNPGTLGGINALTPGIYINAYKTITSTKDNQWRLFAEYSLKYRRQYIENGWDRYDVLRAHEEFVIANTWNNVIKSGIEVRGDAVHVGAYVGYSIPNVELTAIGKQIDVKIGPHFLVGTVINFLIK